MKFTSVKTENCFADAQTYEYALPVLGEAFAQLLTGWSVRINERLRLPVFLAEREGVNVKGILSYNRIKVSFPEDRWQEEKATFEQWLEEIDV